MRITKQKGFSLIELLSVIAIIGLLAGIVIFASSGILKKARDTKRKNDLAQMGRFILSSSCYSPDAGAGDYDLKDLVPELIAKYPQYAQFASALPKDPKSGSDSATNYRYQISSDGHCAIYANLENENEEITLNSITAPTAGAGTGVLRADNFGPNGTKIFYQIGK